MAGYEIYITDKNGKLMRSDYIYTDDNVMDVFERIKDEYAPAFIFKDGQRVFPLDNGHLPKDEVELDEYRRGRRIFS